jgi:hypothetical protein
MSDDADIRRVAAEHVQRHGDGAVDWLLEQARLAYANGDVDAAETWREIGEAAGRMLRG